MQFPEVRMRRNRHHPAVREMVQEIDLAARQFIYPFFVIEGQEEREPVPGMPGMFRQSVDGLIKEAKELLSLGVPAVWLKGFPEKRDERGGGAYARNGIVPTAVKALKDKFPELAIITDVCLCAYTQSGHCGIVRNRVPQAMDGANGGEPQRYDSPEATILNDMTLELLTKAALVYAEAGADMVALSSMMDGQVQSVRRALETNNYKHVPILAFSARFNSGLLQMPEAATADESTVKRASYQIDPANRRQAIREIMQDLSEGADSVGVEPALFYLDILRQVRDAVEVPVVANSVGAELSLVKGAVAAGWSEERALVLELLTCVRRAGADLIITAYAKEAARWLSGDYLL